MAYTTIKKPSDYFNTKLWSGNGSSQALTGVGHQTDMVWIKSRTDTRKHNLYDVVRGVQKRIVPNDTVAEDTATGVTAFGTDGFTVGSETDTNGSSRNFVGWSWNANGAGSANTDGDINSTVSANTTAGFSIVKYSGNSTSNQTIGHGLGSTPKMIIIKRLTNTNSWITYHSSLGATKMIFIDQTSTPSTSAAPFNNTSPTNSVFTVDGNGGYSPVNLSGEDYIAYCFAEKTGYSKFGSYTGNASADGAFIYTGFKPAFVIIKNTDAAESWQMFDGKRPDSNQTNGLYSFNPNTTSAEYQGAALIDFVSNGFKLRSSTNSLNVAQNYIYMAFAEEPLVGDNPATAR